MKLEGKKHIFFDLDHTLWDFEKNSALAFRDIFEAHEVVVDHDAFIRAYVPINVRYWKLFRDGDIDQQQLRYGRFREAFAEVGIDVNVDLITLLSEAYIERLPFYNHLFEGTIEILNYLRANYRLHIITNGFHEVQQRKLSNSGLTPYFETVTNSEMAGCKKPHRDIFEYALRLSGAEKSVSVMVGDCLEADVQGALDCGLDAIFFNEAGQEAHPSIRQVRHLAELKNHL